MLKGLIERYKRHRLYKDTYNSLQRLTDYELKDIGITRGMIREISMDHAGYYNSNNESKQRGWV